MKPLQGSVPVPDPTALTTAALIREIDSLRERTTHDNGMLRELIEARLDASDKAVALLRTTTDKIPAVINENVSRLQELHEEKFGSVAIQFKERDIRSDQTSRDSKVAVDAALKAQQEAFSEQNKSSALAISKSENATTKQIDLIGSAIAALAKAMDDKVADIKERLTGEIMSRITAIESRTTGAQIQKVDAQASTNQSWGFIVGGLGILVSVATLVVLLISRSNGAH